MFEVSSNRKLAILTITLIALLVFCLLLLKMDFIRQEVGSFLAWVKSEGIKGALVFVLVYVIAGLIFFPVLILTLGAGYVYSSIYNIWTGLLVALFLVFTGSVIAASIAMPIGRYLLRGFIQERVKNNRRYQAIEESVNDFGFTLVFLWRVAPMLPFTPFNYIVGITSISYRDYILASVGMLLTGSVEVYIGTSLSSVQEALEGRLQGGSLTLGIIIGVLVLVLGAMAYVSILAKRRIEEILASKSLPNSPMQSISKIS